MTMESALNLARVDTQPGGSGPFAPPADWTGDGETYLALMRQRYCHPGTGQQIGVTARMYREEVASVPVEVEGPWAEQARVILRSV